MMYNKGNDMTLDFINQLVAERNIRWSTHAVERMQERGITRKDVIRCLEDGEIIEEYPDDYPTLSCLVCGRAQADGLIHVVVGCDDNLVYIITAYRPNLTVFEHDLRTRKE